TRSLGRWRRRSRLADHDRLDVDELLDAVRAQLATVAAALDAAEGNARVGGDHRVDKYAARLDLASELGSAADVARPQRGAEAVLGVVGQAHGVVGVASTHHRRDRTEGLLAEGRHVLAYTVEDSRRVEVALAFERLAAGDGVRAGGQRSFDLRGQRLAE